MSDQQNIGAHLKCDRCGSSHPQMEERESYRHPHFALGWYVQWTCKCGKTQCKQIKAA
jgi:hypothetical protein